MDRYRELIKENIDYDLLLTEHPYDEETLEGYVELMVEVCCSRRDFIRIAGEEMAAGIVKSRFLKLNHEHIAYVLDSLSQNTTLVKNIKAIPLRRSTMRPQPSASITHPWSATIWPRMPLEYKRNRGQGMANKIDILVVEPGEAPRPAKVEDTLEAFQQIVGGPIEAGHYLPQRVMLVCNSEGKHMGLMSNRENPTDSGDFIAGTFLLCGFEGEHFTSLTPPSSRSLKPTSPRPARRGR